MDKCLNELIKISRRVGRNPFLAQGASGNTSVKTDDGKYIFIKASGTALANMSKNKGWRRINLEKARAIIKNKKIAKLPEQKREAEIAKRLLACCADNTKGNCRPSIEANLHVLLDKYVIHIHPIAVGAFLNAKNGKAELKKLFAKNKFPPLWISYANPGYSLAKKIVHLSGKYQKKYRRLPEILFLEKHGLFVSASNSVDALNLVSKVIKKCWNKLTCPTVKQIKKPNANEIKNVKNIISAAAVKKKQVYYFYNKNLGPYVHQDDTGNLLKAGALNPNEIIYLKGPIIWLENLQKNTILPKLKTPPVAFIIKNLGLFVIGSAKDSSTAQQVITASLFMRFNASKFGGIVALTKHEQNFISNCGA
ncbi:MAG: class II aldolase/adducin family protein [Sedimentisphaerales bacterium]|jgi:rhamnose utilization protein RhaD (predicted bifunctional aldolase and dehydrogenase)